jgi:hypothetical protein
VVVSRYLVICEGELVKSKPGMVRQPTSQSHAQHMRHETLPGRNRSHPQAKFRLPHETIAFSSSWPFNNAGARQLHSLSPPHIVSLPLEVSAYPPLFRPVPSIYGVPDSYSPTCTVQPDSYPRLPITEQPICLPEYFLQESDSQLVPPHADVLLSQLHSPPIHSISDVDIISIPNPRLVEELNKSPFSNIPPLHTPKIDENARSYHINQPRFRTLGKNAVVCTYNACGAQFSRRSDLNRHHKAIHLRAKTFLCSFTNCARATIGFSRKDKRDDHERKIHGI